MIRTFIDPETVGWFRDAMSTRIESGGAEIEIGERCSVNGKATVSVEFVMTEGEREQMLQRLVDGRVVHGRGDVIEALNLAEPEGV